MGIDISMSVGWGVRLPEDRFAAWAHGIDPEESEREVLDQFLYRSYPGVSYSEGSDEWAGESEGIVLWVEGSVEKFDMGGVPRAGVYSVDKILKPRGKRLQDLVDATEEIVGEIVPAEFLVVVSVS